MTKHGRRRWRMTTALISGLIAVTANGQAFAQTQPQTPAPTTPDAAAKPQTTPQPAAAAPSAPAPSAPAPSANVTVTGQKTPNRIDRQVYDNTKDPDSQTGTASDALNKVPGVNVDPNGNVTLRGKPVQIMLNGRPSLLLQGDNRAAALQAMPSSYVSSIEVISNPGAQYGSEGSGGLINIVTKPKLPPGGFGSMNGQVTSTGGYRASLFRAIQTGKLSVLGVAGFSHGRGIGNTSSVLEKLDSSGHPLSVTQQEGDVETLNDSPAIFGGFEYAATKDDTLTGQMGYVRAEAHRETMNRYGGYNASGAATDLYTRESNGPELSESHTASLTWTHLGKKPDEALKVFGSLSRSISDKTPSNLNTYTLSSVPGNIGQRVDSKHQSNDVKNGVFSVDYNTPVGDDQLTAGLQITHDNSDTNNLAFGPDAVGATPTVNPLLTSEFAYDQTISAVYFTYQREFGAKWTVLGGLRSETLDLDTEQVTSHTTSHIKYTKLNPSLFATYILSPRAKLRFSYSHRLQRPGPAELNPFVTYVDAQNVSAGNPNLKPQETDSYEVGYEYGFKTVTYSVRGFYRSSDSAFVSSSSFVPDPQNAGNVVLLTTRQNGGINDSGGADFNVNAKLNAKMSLSANGTLSFNSLKTPSIPGTQRSTGLNGRITLNYTAANKDRWQVSYNATAKQLTGQGYTLPYGQAQIQYSHSLTKKINLVVVASDVLRTGKYTSVTDTPTIHNVVTSSRVAPNFYIALTRPIGGPPSAPVVVKR